jgi:hypothetical protein
MKFATRQKAEYVDVSADSFSAGVERVIQTTECARDGLERRPLPDGRAPGGRTF